MNKDDIIHQILDINNAQKELNIKVNALVDQVYKIYVDSVKEKEACNDQQNSGQTT